jgi:hypothetical protein
VGLALVTLAPTAVDAQRSPGQVDSYSFEPTVEGHVLPPHRAVYGDLGDLRQRGPGAGLTDDVVLTCPGVPTNPGANVAVTATLDDGTRWEGWADGTGVRADGTFGIEPTPCGYVIGQTVCGYYNFGTFNGEKRTIVRFDFYRWSLHDPSIGVTTRCFKNDPDCHWVPEPGTGLLVATGLLGLAFVGRRRQGGRISPV